MRSQYSLKQKCSNATAGNRIRWHCRFTQKYNQFGHGTIHISEYYDFFQVTICINKIRTIQENKAVIEFLKPFLNTKKVQKIRHFPLPPEQFWHRSQKALLQSVAKTGFCCIVFDLNQKFYMLSFNQIRVFLSILQSL